MSPRRTATRRRTLGWIAAGSLAGALPAPAQPRAQGEGEVDLNLVLAVDASGSVSQARFELQKQGYVAAFGNRRVLQAIRSGPQAAIACAMYQWTGFSMLAPVVPWSRIGDEASIDAFAAAVAAAPRFLYGGGTSVSGAIDHGVRTLAASPFPGGRRVIDVSGDGSNNSGRSVIAARDQAVDAGININGLPILAVEPYLEEYYRSNVIGGPGAFVIAAATFEDFAAAILRKLILEISGLPPSPRRGTSAA